MDVTALEEFRMGLSALMEGTGVYLHGTLQIKPAEEYEAQGYRVEGGGCEVAGEIRINGIPDKRGPFLVCRFEAEPPRYEGVLNTSGKRLMVVGDIEPYDCPVTGGYVGGRAQHRDNLRRHGCHVLEKGEKEHAEKVRERELDAAIGRAAHEMVTAHRNDFEV